MIIKSFFLILFIILKPLFKIFFFYIEFEKAFRSSFIKIEWAIYKIKRDDSKRNHHKKLIDYKECDIIF